MEEFKCTKCGACCRNIGYNEETSFLDIGDGVCKYLDRKTNLCTIYDFRPNICRIDKTYNRYKSKMSYEEYLKLNYEACKELQQIEEEKKKLSDDVLTIEEG